MKTRCLPAVVPAILVLTFSVQAHIVPPEEYHPMAEAYRRAIFMVNLNPVLWNEVRADMNVISAELARISEPRAEVFRRAVMELIDTAEAEATISVATPQMRIQTARGVFEQSTMAVGDAIVLHLEAARENLSDYEPAGRNFDAARQIWKAFEYEVECTDPAMHRSIGEAWLEASSAMGMPGIAGIGGIPADSERFYGATKTIIDYVAANYGEGLEAPEGRLVAMPRNSPSFDENAVYPLKLPPGSNINKQLPRPRQILNMAARGVDENETPLIALGDMAFDSPYIFGEPARSLQISCNTCHNKSITNPQLFIPGLSARAGGIDVSSAFFAPHANNGHYDPLDTPDLRGIRFTAPYGRNGRFASLREFVRNVIVNEFNGPEPSPVILDALIAYMNEFDFLPNPNLNPNGTLVDSASEAAKRGEQLFKKPFAQMNNMSCASCHIPSNHFLDNKHHDIGSVTGSQAYARDGALDTPTLLSLVGSAPYFHDGSLPTLQSVVEWFDGRYELELTDAEIGDLTAYLEAVGDGEEPYEDTIYTLEAELEEFGFFLSSYDFALRMGDKEAVNAIFQTVAAEIRAHKWDIQDPQHLPVLDQMASLMDEAYMHALGGDYAKCEETIGQYRAIYEEHVEVLK